MSNTLRLSEKEYEQLLKKTKRVKIQCSVCLSFFLVYKYEIEQRQRKFCSEKCSAENHRKDIPGKQEIIDFYETQNLSTNDLAVYYKVSKGTIYNWLKLYDISTRTNGQGVSLAQTGKFHSEEHCKAISEAHIKRGSWQGRNHPNILNPEKYKTRRSKTGKRIDLDNKFFRSSWEANWARYLNFLVKNHQILKWEYEIDTFEFVKYKRGSRFYTPDFKVFNLDGTYEYHEIKGYMDAQSQTKLKRMTKCYPKEKVILIDVIPYQSIARQFRTSLPFWE